MKHLALAVSDQARSRRFYETYFGLGARPARVVEASWERDRPD
jgi:catechol 2,3-dioxygenase-like lactoylglutathione lyase family enzyme